MKAPHTRRPEGSGANARGERERLMYQVSRAIYRELSCDIRGGRDEHEAILRVCEATIERMVVDQHYFARPARALFRDLRPHFDIADWPRVYCLIMIPNASEMCSLSAPFWPV